MLRNSLLRYIIYIRNKILYHKKVKFNRSVLIGKNSFFEGFNKIYDYTNFYGELGYCSYIGFNSIICGKIGRFTSIGSNCKTINGQHPYAEPFVSTSPVFYSLRMQTGVTFAKEQYFKEFKYINESKRYDVLIGNDCWLGSGVTIISGVTINDGVVVLANSLVTKDLPPYSIAGGIPAKILKYRYDNDTINFFLKVKWWDKDINWIKENSDLFLDIEKFKKLFDPDN